MNNGPDHDARFMAAAIRLGRTNLGRTGTNPSVATLIVKDNVIVGRGVTAIGGRPHAETEAILEAGEAARGATAYVTLEPCAHHGRTPPCADALVSAGIARVVIAASDPDARVSGKGAAILRNAGIAVTENVLSRAAYEGLSGYLIRSLKKRPEVTLKIAISADGMIGIEGQGQVAITGDIARRMVHVMRAQSDAILIGSGTSLADDPQLTARLEGMESRSPIRIVLDSHLKISGKSKLIASATSTPLWVAALPTAQPEKRKLLQDAGARILSCDDHNGKIALPELLDDLGAEGISQVLVEGGAGVASAFLEDDLVDRIVLFQSDKTIGQGGLPSPLSPQNLPSSFELIRESQYGSDMAFEYRKG